MMSQVTDAYHQLGTLAAQTDPEKLQRALERTASQTERAALGVRKLCEKHSPGVGGYGSRPVLPRMETAGFVEQFGYGWLHIQLNTLLPHCRYQTSDWLSDTIRRLLDDYKDGGSSSPAGRRIWSGNGQGGGIVTAAHPTVFYMPFPLAAGTLLKIILY